MTDYFDDFNEWDIWDDDDRESLLAEIKNPQNHIQHTVEAMREHGYRTLGEFTEAAVAAGFHDDENVDLAAFIAAGSPRPTLEKEN